MADRDSERDRRVRKLIATKDSKEKNELGVVGQAQAEIGDINSDLRNQLQMQQMQESQRLQNSQVISQAAGGMMAMGGSGEDQRQVLAQQTSRMNPSTQAIMQRYGVKPVSNRSVNTSNKTITSKTGYTTNIRTDNITNNKTDIKITQPQIPISQPTIPVSVPRRENNTAKFQAWLSGMFAKQQNEAEIQRKEYRKKEWNLGRTANRLMNRIKEATSNMSNRLDPQNMTSTLGGQLKWLLLIFGATMISKVWSPMMSTIAQIEAAVKTFFGFPINDDLRKSSSGTLGFMERIGEAIGLDKNKSLLEGFKDVFVESIDILVEKLKFLFNERAEAMKKVELPDFDFSFTHPGESIAKSLSNIAAYMGNLLTAGIGGAKGTVKIEAGNIADKAKETFTNTENKKLYSGDNAFYKGSGRNYLRESDYNAFGNLKNEASSTHAMSQNLISLLNDKSGVGHAAEIGTGVGQLMDMAKSSGNVVIDPNLLRQLGLSEHEIQQLKQQKDLKAVKYKLIKVKPNEEHLRESGDAFSWGSKIGGSVPILPSPALSMIADATGKYIDSKVNEYKLKSNGDVYKLVPFNSNEESYDGSAPLIKELWSLTRNGAEMVRKKFMNGSDEEMNMTSKSFYESIKKLETNKKRSSGYTGTITQNISDSKLQAAYLNKESSDAAYDGIDQEVGPHAAKAWNSTKEGFNNLVNGASNFFSGMMGNFDPSIGSTIKSGGGKRFVGTDELKRRANRCMKVLIEKGLSPEVAAGIVGNLVNEGLGVKDLGEERPDGPLIIGQDGKRRFNTEHKNYGPSAGIAGFHDPKGGGGLLSKLKAYAKQKGLDWRLLDTQIAFCADYVSDRGVNYAQKIEQDTAGLSGEARIKLAARMWGNLFERFFNHNKPEGEKEHTKRGNSAVTIYNEYNPNDITTTSFSDLDEDQNVLGNMASGIKGVVGNFSDKVKNFFGMSTNPSEFSQIPMTDEQQKIMNEFSNKQEWSKITNQTMFEKSGAKIDDTGTYIEMDGGYRAYLNPDDMGSSAVFGLDESHIDKIVKFDDKTKKFEHISDEEADKLKKLAVVSGDSFLHSYEGKGTSSDKMDKSIDLGYFTDINGFKQPAISSIKTNLNGRISFKITPTKDRLRIAEIITEIFPVYFEGYSKNTDKLRQKATPHTKVGGTIFKRGVQYPVYGTFKSDGKFTKTPGTKEDGWETYAAWVRLWLTPKAIEQWHTILTVMSYGKLSSDANGNLYRLGKDNEKIYLTDDEKSALVKSNLVSQTISGSVTSTWGSNTSTSTDMSSYNSFLEESDKVLRHGEFNLKDYYESIGFDGSDKKSFYEKNKNQFTVTEGGSIIHSSGVIWGHVDKNDPSKINFMDDSKLSVLAQKGGKEELNRNRQEIKLHNENVTSDAMGIVSRNSMANLAINLEKRAFSSDNIKKVKNSTRSLRSTVETDTISLGGGQDSFDISYYVTRDESGNEIKFYITKKNLASIYSNLFGIQYVPSPGDNNKPLEATSKSELFNKISKFLTSHTKKQSITKSNLSKLGISRLGDSFTKEELESTLNNKFSNSINKSGQELITWLVKEGMKQKSLVKTFTSTGNSAAGYYYKAIFENGYTSKIHLKNKYENLDQIKSKANQILTQNFSNLKKSVEATVYGEQLNNRYSSIIENIKSGKTGAILNEDGTVSTNDGIVGRWKKDDKTGEVSYEALKAENSDDLKIMKSKQKAFKSDSTNKANFYKQYFGNNITQRKDGLYVNLDKNGQKISAKIDLNKEFSQDITKIIDTKSITVDGKSLSSDLGNDWFGFGKSKDDKTNEILNILQKGVEGDEKNLSLTSQYFKDMLNSQKNNEKRALTAEQMRVKQLYQEKKIEANTMSTSEYLKKYLEESLDIDTKDIDIRKWNIQHEAFAESVAQAKNLKGTIFEYTDKDGRRKSAIWSNGRAYELAYNKDKTGVVQTKNVVKDIQKKSDGTFISADNNSTTINKTYVTNVTNRPTSGGGAPVNNQNN